jgi:outer membrane protein OmpA-like peptidoglycan-associated protein
MTPKVPIALMYTCALALVLFLSHAFAASTGETRKLSPGEKAKVSGSILSRNGDLIRVRDKKSGQQIVVSIGDNTKVERIKSTFPFHRHTDMDVTALVPGLEIDAEGVGTSDGELDARKISFNPDEFAIAVAQEQQILANKVATHEAQASADQAAQAAEDGQLSAQQAESSALTAQSSADQASVEAQMAGAVAVADANAVATLNQRVSDLDDYKNEFEVDVFFAEGSVVLDANARRDLANLADIAKSLNGYMIEVSGFAAHYKFSVEEDQKLSEERAAAVASYFLKVKNIPLRRILMPVGYGASERVASNGNAQGRYLNRHVDVKILVNKSLGQGM